MKIKQLLRYYLKSPLNIFISISAVGAVIVCLVLLRGITRIIVPLGIVPVYLIISALLLFSKRGATEIVSVKENEKLLEIRQTIDKYSGVRERISFLRLGDRDIRKAVEYFLLVSGTYLEKCRELSTYSPQANSGIDEALTVCQLYLEELDESSTEKRYSIEDKEEFTGFKQKTLEHIMSLARTIKEKTTEDLAGLSRKDRFTVMEELNK
jgi:hypothetical protein